MAVSFTISVTERDWDKAIGGWRVQALEIPGALIEDMFVNGNKVDPKDFGYDNKLKIVRWYQEQQHPKTPAFVVTLQEELSPQTLTIKWKKLAIILPPVAAIIAALIISTGMARKLSQSEAEKKEIGVIFEYQIKEIIKVNERLRAENYTLYQRLDGLGEPAVGWINGIIKTSNGDPVTNAIVSVRGGNQVLSLPNGEFLLEVMEGDTVQIVYEGNLVAEFVVNQERIGTYISKILPNTN